MAPYITVDALRDEFPEQLSSETKYPDAMLAGIVAEFERKLERWLGYACVTRTRTDRLDVVAGARRLVLTRPLVQAVSGVNVVDAAGATTAYTGGFTIADPEVGVLQLHRALSHPEMAHRQAVVTYTHGTAVTAPDVVRACALYVWREATAQRNPNTGNSYMALNNELGIVERESTADWEGNRPTGWLDVDRILVGLERLDVLP